MEFHWCIKVTFLLYVKAEMKPYFIEEVSYYLFIH